MCRNRENEQHKYSKYAQQTKRINRTKNEPINRLYEIKITLIKEKEKHSKGRANTSKKFFTIRERNLRWIIQKGQKY